MTRRLKIATVVYITQKEEQYHCELFQTKKKSHPFCTTFYSKGLHKYAAPNI